MNYLFLFVGGFQLGRVFYDFHMKTIAGGTAIAFGIGASLLFLAWRGTKPRKNAPMA